MKYSLNWIKKFTDIPEKIHPFLDKMAIDGFETEGIERNELDPKIVVARIDKVQKHPNADKLSLCEVYVGLNKFQIVCGAKNLYPDMMVALAKIGAKLPGGLKIKKSKIRNVISEGMLCSASELKLAESSPEILDLKKDILESSIEIKEGATIGDVFNFPQTIVDFNITPDRSYALSHFAIAQEIAILNNQKCTMPKQDSLEITDSNTKLSPSVDQQAKKACPKYLLRSIKGIEINQPTPVFITNQLIQSGINCINPVVDILNFVMIEYGQPMHAFDASKIDGDIKVCFANDNNTIGQIIELINHDKVSIQKDTLLICDEKKPIALAGVMGSLNTAVDSDSTDILIESAYFDSIAIAGKSRNYNLSSDAAYRYERGVDFNLAHKALERASGLIVEFLSGSVSNVFNAISESDLPKLKPITLEFKKVNKVLGLKLSNRDIVEILSRICDVEYTDSNLSLLPPSNRYDLRIEEDLIEEIVRIHGYQNIATNKLKVASKQYLAPQFSQKRIRDFFVDRGYNETINYSFISQQYHQLFHPNIQPIVLDNPISKDKSTMRYSLLAGLIETYLQNKKYKNELNQFFEIGACFSASNDKENPFIESTKIAGILAGNKFKRNWVNSSRELDFYDLKGDLESLFEIAGINVNFEAQNQLSCLHPNQSAKLTTTGEKKVGYAGFINPETANALSINEKVLVFELDLDIIISKPAMKFSSFSRFPQVKRDLSFLVNNDIGVKQIHQCINVLNIKDLISYQIFDVYQEKNAKEKSIGIELCFQSNKKTLTEEQIEKMLQNIIDKLIEVLSAKLRDV